MNKKEKKDRSLAYDSKNVQQGTSTTSLTGYPQLITVSGECRVHNSSAMKNFSGEEYTVYKF